MDDESALPLPLPLRAWARTRGFPHFRGRERIAIGLAQRLLKPDRTYIGADGFKLRIDPRDRYHALMLLGIWEIGSVAVIRRFARPGSVTIDAGSHIGYLALHAARAVGADGVVHAFECDPRLIGLLREHAAINELSWLRPAELALTDHDGREPFFLSPQRGWSSLHSEQVAQQGPSVEVACARLDSYVEREELDPEDISFIKVDVEGLEAQVLAGAEATLGRTRAALLMEIHPRPSGPEGGTAEDAYKRLESLGYEPWRFQAPRGAGSLSLEPLTGFPSGDVLFLKPGSAQGTGP
jgi:FkbM family methyltransferase